MTTDEHNVQERLRHVEALIQTLEGAPDPAARDAARALARVLLDLHAAGLERMLALTQQGGERGPALVERFARDGLVGSLLLLHALHPEPAERRVPQALERMRPRLRALGGDAEAVEVNAAAVRVRLRGAPSSGPALRHAVEEALLGAAPDVPVLEFEEAWDP